MVCRDYPTWRTIIFPFYSLKEVIFIFLLISILTFIIFIIGHHGSLYRYSLAAYLGAAFVAHSGSPSHMRRSRQEVERIKSYLNSSHFAFDSTGNLWRPKWPKVLLWSHNCVKIHSVSRGIMVCGPYSVLRDLYKTLEYEKKK